MKARQGQLTGRDSARHVLPGSAPRARPGLPWGGRGCHRGHPAPARRARGRRDPGRWRRNARREWTGSR